MEEKSNLWYVNVNLSEFLCPVANNLTGHVAKDFKKGELIYFTNEISDKVYYIDKGKVKLGSYSADGKEIIKAILAHGEIFGEMSLLGEEHRTDFAVAMEDTMLCMISTSEMQSLMEIHHPITLKITKIIGARLMKAERRLESLVFKDARTRIMEYLKEIADEKGIKIGIDECLIKDVLTHQEIANLTGTSRQTVTTILNQLRDDNIIYFDRQRMLIRDKDRLN